MKELSIVAFHSDRRSAENPAGIVSIIPSICNDSRDPVLSICIAIVLEYHGNSHIIIDI